MSDLMDGKASTVKYVFKIEETPGLKDIVVKGGSAELLRQLLRTLDCSGMCEKCMEYKDKARGFIESGCMSYLSYIRKFIKSTALLYIV